MDYSSLPVFSLMQQKMQYLSARQAVLAQNVSNVDTPDYRARDIKNVDFSRMVQGSGALKLATTSPKHFTGNGANAAGMYQVIDRAQTNETNINGNRVSLDEEMQKVAQTQLEYQMVTGVYGKTVGLLKTAIGRGGQG